MKPLRVAIDARFPSGKMGGIEQFVLGLAHGLASLDPGNERYAFLVNRGETSWLDGKLSENMEYLFTNRDTRDWSFKFSRLFSDGVVERASIDVVHFTWQFAFLTSKPNIYHPHDLQHVHLPQNFSPTYRLGRSLLYRLFCWRATTVAVGTTWVGEDVVKSLGVSQQKVQVVNLAPVTGSYPSPTADELDAVKLKFGITEGFVFYPAQTWPHKNHLRLIEAIARVRENLSEDVRLICSGAPNRQHQPLLDEAVRRAGLERKIQFLGFVSPKELRALYALSKLVCIPTLFEAASFPMWEAFESGVPVACSRTTSLPAQAGEAAVFFDGNDVADMTRAITDLWCDRQLRNRLIAQGHARVLEFNWTKTAKRFRALYRKLGGVALSEDDHETLATPALF